MLPLLATNTPKYAVRIYARSAGTFGIGSMIMEVANPKNIGYADYLNDVPEAFFTLFQEDAQVQQLRDLESIAHVRIYRIDPALNEEAIVWTGLLGTEVDSEGTDVIFYCHGYLAALYWLLTAWDQAWNTETLDTIVSDLWTRAKTTITSSELNFVTTGTIQAPATVSGGSTPIILPVYTTFYKRILFVLRELAAIGRSDTTNAVVFEITHSATPTFNFWGAKGSDTNVVYRWASRDIQNFKQRRMPIYRRNAIRSVGSSPRDAFLRKDIERAVGVYGRREEPVYFQWARDQTELDRVAAYRIAKADRIELNVELIAFPGAIIPPGMSYSPWDLADRIRVQIDRGATNINAMFLVSGYQVYYVNGLEYTKMFLEDRAGT